MSNIINADKISGIFDTVYLDLRTKSIAHISAESAIIGVLFVIFGVVLLALGKKLVKPIIFISSFLVTFLLSLQFSEYIINAVVQDKKSLPKNITTYVSLAFGIICGVIALFLAKVGLFLLGGAAGYFLATLVLQCIPIDSLSDLMITSILIIFPIFCGLLLIYFQKYLFAVFTAIIGSVTFCIGSDIFVRSGFALHFFRLLYPKSHPMITSFDSELSNLTVEKIFEDKRFIFVGIAPILVIFSIIYQLGCCNRSRKNKEIA